ncbi:hypothetical protein [Fusobacterium animalis]
MIYILIICIIWETILKTSSALLKIMGGNRVDPMSTFINFLK